MGINRSLKTITNNDCNESFQTNAGSIIEKLKGLFDQLKCGRSFLVFD